MRIREKLDKKRTLSFEFFPPKEDQPMESIKATIDELAKFKPDFMSVTYGAGGSNKGRNDEVCRYVMKNGIETLSHFTIIGSRREDALSQINSYLDMGVENILALRGDYPEGWIGTRGDYNHASELMEGIRKRFPQMAVAGACYPEKHFEAASLDEDLNYLKHKQDVGADFFITQLCYDLEKYEKFMELAAKKGITNPIVVGILPVLFKGPIVRITQENGCSRPKELEKIIEKYSNSKDDFKKAGMEYTATLIEKYLEFGVAGIHIYTMNKYKDVSNLIEMVGL